MIGGFVKVPRREVFSFVAEKALTSAPRPPATPHRFVKQVDLNLKDSIFRLENSKQSSSTHLISQGEILSLSDSLDYFKARLAPLRDAFPSVSSTRKPKLSGLARLDRAATSRIDSTRPGLPSLARRAAATGRRLELSLAPTRDAPPPTERLKTVERAANEISKIIGSKLAPRPKTTEPPTELKPHAERLEAVGKQLTSAIEVFNNETVFNAAEIKNIEAVSKFAAEYHPYDKTLDVLSEFERSAAFVSEQVTENATIDFESQLTQAEKLLDSNEQMLNDIAKVMQGTLVPILQRVSQIT